MRAHELAERCLRIGLVVGVVACISAYALSLSTREGHRATTSPTSTPASVNAPQRPGHLYSWHRHGFYGYETIQSEFSREHGDPAPAVAYWYEGQHDGTYRLRQFNGRFVDVVTCTDPCETVTVLSSSARATIELRPDTPLWAAVQDMLHGQLELHR